MGDYLTSISPDSFSGALFAFEGVPRTTTLLNGPTGCKFFHSSISDNQLIRQSDFDPLQFPPTWYFGQPRVPCTFLDNADYVYGSADKLVPALEYLSAHVAFDLLAVVNSPGAALIGDDLAGIVRSVVADKPVVVMETPGFSSDICHGHEAAALALLKQLRIGDAPANIASHPRVNLLGMSLFHRYHTGDVAELRRLLGLCGIEVGCALCAGSGLDEVRRLPEAQLNVVVHPEYGLQTAKWLEERCHTPWVAPDLSVGFDATEAFVRTICELVGADLTPAIEDSERARARCFAFISRVHSLIGLPKGVSFAVEGTWSEAAAYTAFLTGYLGMIPECVSITSPRSDCARDRLEGLLEGLGLPHIAERDILETDAELLFASGNTIARHKLSGKQFAGIETALPTMGYLDVVPKTHLGVAGAMLLVEMVLNAL